MDFTMSSLTEKDLIEKLKFGAGADYIFPGAGK
jgi:hypothetical protein